MSRTLEYGNCGAGHRDIVDRYLRTLPPGAHVLNLGCGPNSSGEIDNLADRLTVLSRGRAHLIAADYNPMTLDRIRESFRNGVRFGRRIIELRQVDATDMTGTVATESIDLVLALGLFGDLRYGPDQNTVSPNDPGVCSAYGHVLAGCFRVLRVRGIMLVSNSVKRQPEQMFTALALQAGFLKRESDTALAADGPPSEDHSRYLLALLRPGK